MAYGETLDIFDPKKFVDDVISVLRSRYVGIKGALAAISGGVDSTTSAILVYKALGNVVRPVFIDTGFMRLNEGSKVKRMLSNVFPLEVINRSNEFYSRLLGLADAEVKRKVFRDVFYEVIGKLAEEYGCDYVVQGTIAADVVETLGGIKTQHNVLTDELLSKYGLKVIEPLRDLYKEQVRLVAKYVGVPDEIIHRQPFPGPGLLVRVVGEFKLDKLRMLQEATEIVESRLEGLGISQYFPAIWEYDFVDEGRLCKETCIDYSTFKVKATGVKNGKRVYGPVVLIRGLNVLEAIRYYKYFEDMNASHVILLIKGRDYGKYFISLRAITTKDFMTANVYLPQPELIEGLANELINKLEGVCAVGYDITPKPPATIEYE